MHPGTLAFNAVPENAKLADRWGIVMGSSHSEALLRNNVGDLKPAEIDTDYFMQLGSDEPAMAATDESTFLTRWAAEQFPVSAAPAIADIMARYYQLNFIRKPEFMGFNGYNDGINRTAFNPNAWSGTSIEGDVPRGQNSTRMAEWTKLRDDTETIATTIPALDADAFFELIGYPVEAAAAMNMKFLQTDRTFLYASLHDSAGMQAATAKAKSAYDTIHQLTAHYNSMEGGKWDGMMSDAPRKRHVFEMPRTALDADATTPLPATWFGGAPGLLEHDSRGTQPLPLSGFQESLSTVSINAAHFARKQDAAEAQWAVLPDLGISGGSVEFGAPGRLANEAAKTKTAWLEYDFRTISKGDATLTLHLLPTFPVDSQHRLRFGVSMDGGKVMEQDLSGTGEWKEGNAPSWAGNVLRNSAMVTIPLGSVTSGPHTLRLLYRDPGIVFEHIVLTFPGAPPAYPVPPETRSPAVPQG
jgi:hypothetical protein